MPREGTKICFTNVCKGLPCIISGSVGVVLYTITQKQEVLFVFMYFYCIVNGLVHFPQLNAVHPPMSSSQNYNPHAYLVPYAHCNTLKFSFSVLLSDYGIVSPSKLIRLNIYKSLNITYHLFSSLPNYYLFILNYLLGTLHLLATAIIV